MSDEKPLSTAEHTHVKTIHELLGLTPAFFAEKLNLSDEPVPSAIRTAEADDDPGRITTVVPEAEIEASIPKKASAIFQKPGLWQKDIVRLPVIFAVCLVIFYLLLNFRSVSSQISAWFAPLPKNETAVLGAVQPDFDAWIKKYYAAANDMSVLAANEDADQDGLTNTDEFYLGTNPLLADTDNDGYDDGTEVLHGYNPLYAGRLTAEQQQIIAAHLDLQAIQNRKNFSLSFSSGGQAGSVSGNFNNNVGSATPTYSNPLLLTDNFLIEPAKAGNVSIPKLGTNVAVVWTQDFAKMNDDLKYGVAHHPATPYPGQSGLSSIHGHSSGYPWDGNYKTVFTRLNYLVAGDDVFVTVFAANGEERRFRYVVKSAKVYAKDDQAQFTAPGEGAYLNLSTSWPIGTARERYVVTCELAGM